MNGSRPTKAILIPISVSTICLATLIEWMEKWDQSPHLHKVWAMSEIVFFDSRSSNLNPKFEACMKSDFFKHMQID